MSNSITLKNLHITHGNRYTSMMKLRLSAGRVYENCNHHHETQLMGNEKYTGPYLVVLHPGRPL